MVRYRIFWTYMRMYSHEMALQNLWDALPGRGRDPDYALWFPVRLAAPGVSGAGRAAGGSRRPQKQAMGGGTRLSAPGARPHPPDPLC